MHSKRQNLERSLNKRRVPKRERIRERLLRICGVVLVVLMAFAFNTWDLFAPTLFRDDQPNLKQTELPIFDRLFIPIFLKLKGHRDQPSPQVSTVSFGGGEQAFLQNDPCRGRRYMADLIDALNDLGTKVIVIDKYYPNDSCSDEEANRLLRRAMSSSSAHVVVGLETDELEGKDRSWALALTTHLAFDRSIEASGVNDLISNHPVVEALIRFNQNLIKIPLQWPVYEAGLGPNSNPGEGERELNTLSFAAARIADPTLTNRRGLMRLLNSGVDPYGESSTLQLSEVTEAEVLCSDQKEAAAAKFLLNWHLQCGAESKAAVQSIVVIGSPALKDRKDLAGRSLFGYRIHAIYIEELLSARYLVGIPFWLWYSMLLVWVVVTQAWLIWTDSPWRVLSYISVGTVVLIVLSMVLLILGDYFPPFTFIFYILVSLAVMIFLEIAEAFREQRAEAK